MRIVRPRWSCAVFVCGKCLKRHQDGKALKSILKLELKKQTGGKSRKPRIIRTACVGLCPRGAVVIASAATLATGQVALAKNASEVIDAIPALLARDA